mmetsp:Transcript_44401/g.78069  ORF Transcript_44401/g.78069 Transcript_44401/m.78069 type:complete len:106 (+) Transcript_44401:714-1031(+)
MRHCSCSTLGREAADTERRLDIKLDWDTDSPGEVHSKQRLVPLNCGQPRFAWQLLGPALRLLLAQLALHGVWHCGVGAGDEPLRCTNGDMLRWTEKDDSVAELSR